MIEEEKCFKFIWDHIKSCNRVGRSVFIPKYVLAKDQVADKGMCLQALSFNIVIWNKLV